MQQGFSIIVEKLTYRKIGTQEPRRLQVGPWEPKMSRWDPGTPKWDPGPATSKYSNETWDPAPQKKTRDQGPQEWNPGLPIFYSFNRFILHLILYTSLVTKLCN